MDRSVKHSLDISSSDLDKWKCLNIWEGYISTTISGLLWKLLKLGWSLCCYWIYLKCHILKQNLDSIEYSVIRNLISEKYNWAFLETFRCWKKTIRASTLTMFVVDSFRWIMKDLINTDYRGVKLSAPYGTNKYEIITTRPWLSIW